MAQMHVSDVHVRQRGVNRAVKAFKRLLARRRKRNQMNGDTYLQVNGSDESTPLRQADFLNGH